MSEAGWGAPPPEDPWATQQGGWGGQEQQAPAQSQSSGNHTPPSQEEYLANDSVKSFSFDAPIGTTLDGIVESAKVVQKMDYGPPPTPAFWDNGEPKWTLRVHVQTTLNEFPEDDGLRSVFFDYRKREALDLAFKAAGVKPVVEPGARVRLRYVSGGPKEVDKRTPGATRDKKFEAIYNPPGTPDVAALQQQITAAAHAAPAQQSPPAQQQGWGAPAQAASPADLWKGLNQAAVNELSAAGLGPQDVLPHIQGREGWQGAPASQIKAVLPRPAPKADTWQGGYSDEPPF